MTAVAQVRVRNPAKRWLERGSYVSAQVRIVAADWFDHDVHSVVPTGHFKDLVIARIVEPTSLLDVERVLGKMGQEAANCTRMNQLVLEQVFQ